MAQRIAIARALSCNPKLLIADEPTTALDVTVQQEILDLFRDLQDEFGMAILFVTHDLAVAADICDRIAVMYAGEIVEVAPVDALFAEPRHPYTAGLLAAMPHASDRHPPLPTIRGTVPRPGSWPTGCRFSDRCDFSGRGASAHSPDRARRPAGALRPRGRTRSGGRGVSDEPLLEIRDLWVTYWQRSGLGLRRTPFHAVKGATLSIRPGETVGLVGESGSGKSSIANTVLGLVPAASGSIRFGDD